MPLSGHAEKAVLKPLHALAAIALGTTLLLPAIPVVISDLLLIPGNPVVRQLQHEQKTSESDIRNLIYSRKNSGKWREASKTYTDMALGYLILENYPSHEDYPGNLQQAEKSLIKGLALAPMNPYGWMRLAQVRKIRNAPIPQIAGALKLAMKSGHNEDKRHFMLLLMVEIGLEVWGQLNDQEREIIAQKARKAWDRDPWRTSTLAVRSGNSGLLAILLGF